MEHVFRSLSPSSVSCVRGSQQSLRLVCAGFLLSSSRITITLQNSYKVGNVFKGAVVSFVFSFFLFYTQQLRSSSNNIYHGKVIKTKIVWNNLHLIGKHSRIKIKLVLQLSIFFFNQTIFDMAETAERLVFKSARVLSQLP